MRKRRAAAIPPAALTRRFHQVVNLTADEIEAWLKTEESQAVGFTYPGERESVGRKSAKKIIRILREGPRPSDFAHMRKVVGYVARHRAQRPRGDVRHTRWRYSLLNWGHDPLKRGVR